MDVNTLLFGLLLFGLQERVPEPSHDKAALKTDPLRHPLARRDLDDLADACATLKNAGSSWSSSLHFVSRATGTPFNPIAVM